MSETVREEIRRVIAMLDSGEGVGTYSPPRAREALVLLLEREPAK